MKIGLYGIYGVYNFGCEAIVRGTYKFIRDIYPNSQIVYYSFSYSYDKRILNDLDMDIESVEIDNLIFKRVINKFFKTLKINKQCMMFNANKIIDNIDLLVSIGGDIYTIPQVLRDNPKYCYYNPLVDFCDRAIRKGKAVIVYGASVGPWGNYKKAVDYNVKALSKYNIILCREKETIGYLQSLGLNNVLFFPDPAFQIRGKFESKPKKYIGINLSPLSFTELYGGFDENCISKLATLLDRLYEKTGVELLFVPHVLSPSEEDNDFQFMKKIRDFMHYKDHIVIADTSKGFMGVKESLSQCYVVAAARMHCAINAIDENVPVVFLSYSQKSIGMCKYIYGSGKMLIDLKNIETELVDKIVNIIEQSEQISKSIAKRNDEIRQYYEANIAQVKEIITFE